MTGWLSRERRLCALGLLALAALVLVAARQPSSDALRLELGGPADRSFLGGAWSRGVRFDLDGPATSDGVLSFYARLAGPGARVDLPLRARGALTLRLRTRAVVRSMLSVSVARQQPPGRVLVSTERFSTSELALPEAGSRDLQLELALRPLARTRGAHVGSPEIAVDWVELQAAEGLRLSPSAGALLAGAPLLLGLLALALGASGRLAAGCGAAAAVAVVAAARLAPLTALAALPRLLPLALGAGALCLFALRRSSVRSGERCALGALVAAGTLAHGSLVFLPNHNPPDLATHVDRALDLGRVPFEYQALLRYGSHLPTASQRSAPATDLFGQSALVPYAPLPYFVYYALAWLGFDLYWALTAFGAALAMGVAVGVWLAVARLWDRPSAWLATALYTLDLAVWHHLGRAHAPAVLGQALATFALLHLAANAEQLDDRRRVLVAGILLSLGALGYTSQVVLLGLFGLTLLALLLVDARGLRPAARRGLGLALVLGGLLAFFCYYGHYLPGLLREGGARAVEAEPEIFTGKRVLWLFRNEGRQSYRIWALGFALPLVAGLAAAPLALRRCRASARPVLVAWFAAWALAMLLKDPLFFPKTLRWAKEDQFVSPLLCLWVAAGVFGLSRRSVRLAACTLVLATAVWLQLRDFWLHANTLGW